MTSDLETERKGKEDVIRTMIEAEQVLFNIKKKTADKVEVAKTKLKGEVEEWKKKAEIIKKCAQAVKKLAKSDDLASFEEGVYGLLF